LPITGELQEAASKYGRKYGWLSGPSRSRAPDTISNSLCRTSSASPIYSRLAGYEDTNDAEQLAEDPTFRILAARERRETGVALTSALNWFATDVLAEERNYEGLGRLNTALIEHTATRSPTRRVILDIDSDRARIYVRSE